MYHCVCETYGLDDPGHRRRGQTKQIFSFQVNWEKLQGSTGAPYLSDWIQDLVPHSCTHTQQCVKQVSFGPLAVNRTGVHTFGRGSGQDEVFVSFLHHLHLEQRPTVRLLDVTHVLTASAGANEKVLISPINKAHRLVPHQPS